MPYYGPYRQANRYVINPNLILFSIDICYLILLLHQGEYPPKGIYLGNRDDRQVQLSKLYADFAPKYTEIVTDPSTVLKETIGAYNNTLLVLLQTYSIVSTSAVTGNPKCDDPPKKESYKLVIRARDEGILCLDAARTGILSDAGDAESIKQVSEITLHTEQRA